jgi:hypothetical protein
MSQTHLSFWRENGAKRVRLPFQPTWVAGNEKPRLRANRSGAFSVIPSTGRLAWRDRLCSLASGLRKLDGDEDDAHEGRERGRGNPIDRFHGSVP